MNETFEIKVNGEVQEVKMSFGMLHVIASLVGDIEAVPEMGYNPDLREAVLNELLSKRDKKGKILEQIDMFNLDVATDDVVDLINWAGEHVADFFLKSLTKAKKLVDSRQEQMQDLQPTSTGGET